jgi:hypothetical protein
VLAFIAVDFLGVLTVLRGIFFLGGCQFLGNAHGRHFITADSPEQNFLLARVGIEVPHIAMVDEWYRCRPIFRTNV